MNDDKKKGPMTLDPEQIGERIVIDREPGMELDPEVDRIEVIMASQPDPNERLLRPEWMTDEEYREHVKLFHSLLGQPVPEDYFDISDDEDDNEPPTPSF
ncbi:MULTISPECIES: hypothetical protein [unclassified Pannonibacter]|uniref:hypothetical protein n=1 Tax=unclassified Pannonibacter TaxID=2627228 RepID=UPI001645EEDF|nr:MULTISPECIES: hypothetical protein [unclassified Pannonibacter]